MIKHIGQHGEDCKICVKINREQRKGVYTFNDKSKGRDQVIDEIIHRNDSEESWYQDC